MVKFMRRVGTNFMRKLVIILLALILVGCTPIATPTPKPTLDINSRMATQTAYLRTQSSKPTNKPKSNLEICVTSGIGVRYVIEGVGVTGVSLTFENDTGGTDQGDYNMPFCKTFTNFDSNDFLYISAQIILPTSNAGSITCKIYDGSTVISEAHASGFPSIATCSGSKN